MGRLAFQLGAALEGSVDQEIAAGRKRVEFAAASAMKEIGTDNLGKLRADVTRGLRNGGRLAATWRGKLYVNSGLNPAYTLTSKAPMIVSAFENGEEIRSSNGFWLTIPNPELRIPARRQKRGRSIVGQYEARFGKLRFVFLKGRRDLALLVTDVRRGKTGKYGKASDAAKRRGDFKETVVFFLVPKAKAPRLLRGAELRRRMTSSVPADFQRAFDRFLDQAESGQAQLTFKGAE